MSGLKNILRTVSKPSQGSQQYTGINPNAKDIDSKKVSKPRPAAGAGRPLGPVKSPLSVR